MKRVAALCLVLSAFCLLFSACPHATAPPVPPAPVPSPAAKFGSTEIWFAPDIGALDYQTLFSDPNQWAQTRGKVKVFKFYPQALISSDPCLICGPNKLPAFIQSGAFAKLKAWGIDVAIEAPAIKEWGCSASVTLPPSQAAVDAVNQNGGALAWLMMDEPLYAATTTVFLNPATTQRCGMTFDQGVAQIKLYMAGMTAANPGLKIGINEPYPIFNAQTLIQLIHSLPGLQAFHIDIDHDQQLPTLGPDLAAISTACKSAGIPFGIIFGGQVGQGKDFIAETNKFIGNVQSAYGTPPVVIFQSWMCVGGVCNTPATLPESNPSTLSGVLLNSTQ